MKLDDLITLGFGHFRAPSRALLAAAILCLTLSAAWADAVFQPLGSFTRPPTVPVNAGLVKASDGFLWGTTAAGGVEDVGTIFKVKADGTEWQVVASFSRQPSGAPLVPNSVTLLDDGQGYLWGTSAAGGNDGAGSIFKVQVSTGVVTRVASFTFGMVNVPAGGLFDDGNGFYWGVAESGGPFGAGGVFKLQVSTGQLTEVAGFSGTGGPTPGRSANAQTLALGPDGKLWGTTQYGGANNAGVIFKVDRATGVMTTVVEFSGGGGAVPGGYPNGGLASDGAQSVWGTLATSGAQGFGYVYAVDVTTGALTVKASFTGNPSDPASGKYPSGALLKVGAGTFWGTTSDGGAGLLGSIFKVDIATGQITTVSDLTPPVGAPAISSPFCTLMADGNGRLWGLARVADRSVGVVFGMNEGTGAIEKAVVLDESLAALRGQRPTGPLVDDGSGLLWGVTSNGGNHGTGTIFTANPNTGVLTTVGHFDPVVGGSNSIPGGGLVPDGQGELWGVASFGGLPGNPSGSIYRVNVATKVRTNVQTFTGSTGSVLGAAPTGELVDDGTGFFWGTTQFGGANFSGAVFKIAKATGDYTLVASLSNTTGSALGFKPNGTLVPGGDGWLYGTTRSGGTDNLGTVFKVNITTHAFATVEDFRSSTASTRGGLPAFPLVNDGAGNLWGTTAVGGANGEGTIFKIPVATGTLTVVGSMEGVGTPASPLVKDPAGRLFGFGQRGSGRNVAGTFFMIRPATGEISRQLYFTGSGPGAAPGQIESEAGGSLLLAGDGSFYGTTQKGGVLGGGDVFRVVPDLTTQTPTLLSPVASSKYGRELSISYTLPEAALPGSVRVTFSGSSTVQLTPAGTYETAATHTFTINPANLAASTDATADAAAIADGSYTVTLSYRDGAGNPAASATTTQVTIDTATQAPTLDPPLNGNVLASPLTFNAIGYSLPEAALAGSVKLTFDNGSSSYVVTLGGVGETAGSHIALVNPASPNRAGNGITPSVSGSPIPDGTYTVTLSYRDAVGNPEATAAQNAIVTDTITQAPTLISPATNAVVGHTASGRAITLRFTLPEALGVLSLSFSGQFFALDPAQFTVGPEQTVTFDPADPVGTSGGKITSGTPIADGVYAVTLSSSDVYGNPTAAVTKTNVRVDTVLPTINLPTNGFTGLRTVAGTLPNYSGQITTTDASTVTITQSPLPSAATTYTGIPLIVTLTATDAAGNQATTDISVDVRPPAPLHTVLYTAGTKTVPGDAAPGAGSGGPPTDAKLASFGPPAIDENGNVAFLATWTSATGPLKKGAGIFIDAPWATMCLATLGGPTPVSGASYKSFQNPVISGGRVAFLATLSGVPKGQESVILSNGATGTLDVVARSGKDAFLGGPTFKKFVGVQILGNSVGFLAQVAGGTGASKITGANDLGLWARSGTAAPVCTLREGDPIDPTTVGAPKIKTLVSFAVGGGSPGQGRGWLSAPAGVVMPALVILDDAAKTQAVVGGTALDPEVFSIAGSTTSGPPDVPGLTGETFRSYSLPALNELDDLALLATLNPTAPVTKANAQGVFTATNPGVFTPLARLTETAPGTGGATFSVLKDPVLAADGGIAFPATLKGATIKGAAASTLWWRPAGVATANLFAQGGPTTAGVPEVGASAEFKTFPSLAISATRGPIFTATLAAGKGGVPAPQTSGVWAVDFTGTTRRLLQNGATVIGGKTLKSFNLLTAVTGSVGVTRSFNDDGDVAWLATFTDGSTAIVKTVVP